MTAEWDVLTQIREEVSFTAGQVLVKEKTVDRGKPKRADYVLFYRPNLPLAVVEAKDNKQTIGAGMQQALAYADDQALDLLFVFNSNGDGFLFHDKTAIGPVVRRRGRRVLDFFDYKTTLDRLITPATGGAVCEHFAEG